MQNSIEIARPERLLRAREVYDMRLGISRSTFYELVSTGEFPPAVRITRQRVGWKESAVDNWIKSRPTTSRQSMADAGAR